MVDIAGGNEIGYESLEQIFFIPVQERNHEKSIVLPSQ